MAFRLPELPYSKSALAPHISAETLEYHHGRHHRAYVETLNQLVEGRPESGMSLEDLVRTSEGKIFNNAGQHWNHTFYWSSMSPKGGGEPRGKVAELIKKSFGRFADFKQKFSEAAVGQFGSGWAWLIREGDGLAIVTTADADNPLRHGQKPLMTCDVWEHAYYIDYRNERPKYLEAWWNVVDWDFVEKNL
jgi:Fe-Mn family superoxide dismutase